MQMIPLQASTGSIQPCKSAIGEWRMAGSHACCRSHITTSASPEHSFRRSGVFAGFCIERCGQPGLGQTDKSRGDVHLARATVHNRLAIAMVQRTSQQAGDAVLLGPIRHGSKYQKSLVLPSGAGLPYSDTGEVDQSARQHIAQWTRERAECGHRWGDGRERSRVLCTMKKVMERDGTRPGSHDH